MRGPEDKKWSRCQLCNGFAEVRDSRVNSNGWRNRRRRCTACGHSWHTYEVPAELLHNFKAFVAVAQEAKQHIDKLEQMTRGLNFDED